MMNRPAPLLPALSLALLLGCATQRGALTNPDAAPGDMTGLSVALSGDVLLSGVRLSDALTLNAGKALMYRFDGATWAVEETLFPTMPAPNGEFGYSVDTDGDRAIAGAWLELDPGGLFISGAAYIFEWDGANWTPAARLTGTPTLEQDAFGLSVALSGDYAAVGTPFGPPPTFSGPGVVYVFRRDPGSGTWIQDTLLTASDGSNNDDFGYAVSLDGDALLVGARFDDDDGSSSGSAYVFRRSGSGWVEEAKLTALDAQAGDRFGVSVGLSGDLAAVGAEREDESGDEAGAAYLFERDAATDTWTPAAKLLAFDGDAGDQFGRSIAADGDAVVVGAWLADGGAGTSGAAYLFRKSAVSDTWVSSIKLLQETGAYGDGFGISVDLSGDCAAVGAPNQAIPAGDLAGATYVFCDLPGLAPPEFEIDIICCESPPDPLGPVVFTLRYTGRGAGRSIVERWVDVRAPDGQTTTVLPPDQVVAPANRTREERGIVRLGPSAPQGTYRLDLYWKNESGVLSVESATFQR